jgi:hypothetical protein
MENLNDYLGLPANPNKQNGLIGNADLANILMGIFDKTDLSNLNFYAEVFSLFTSLPYGETLSITQQPSGSVTNIVYGALTQFQVPKGRLSYINIGIKVLTGNSPKVIVQGSYDNVTFFDIGGISHATNNFITPITGLSLNDSIRIPNDFRFYRLKALSVSGNIDLTAISTFS